MPGAGSVVASNFFSNAAPRDGSVVLIGTGQLLLRILLGLDGAKSKAGDFEPIIASPMGRIAIIRKSAGITDPKQLLNPATPLVLGVPEVIATLDTVLGLKVLDAKFRAVMGYPGKVDTRLALEHGEVNLDGQTTPLYREAIVPMVKSGVAEPLFAQGLVDQRQFGARSRARPIFRPWRRSISRFMERTLAVPPGKPTRHPSAPLATAEKFSWRTRTFPPPRWRRWSRPRTRWRMIRVSCPRRSRARRIWSANRAAAQRYLVGHRADVSRDDQVAQGAAGRRFQHAIQVTSEMAGHTAIPDFNAPGVYNDGLVSRV